MSSSLARPPSFRAFLKCPKPSLSVLLLCVVCLSYPVLSQNSSVGECLPYTLTLPQHSLGVNTYTSLCNQSWPKFGYCTLYYVCMCVWCLLHVNNSLDSATLGVAVNCCDVVTYTIAPSTSSMQSCNLSLTT